MKHREVNQVELDVDRSFWRFPDGLDSDTITATQKTKQMQRRGTLTQILNAVLACDQERHYYQGKHNGLNNAPCGNSLGLSVASLDLSVSRWSQLYVWVLIAPLKLHHVPVQCQHAQILGFHEICAVIMLNTDPKMALGLVSRQVWYSMAQLSQSGMQLGAFRVCRICV